MRVCALIEPDHLLSLGATGVIDLIEILRQRGHVLPAADHELGHFNIRNSLDGRILEDVDACIFLEEDSHLKTYRECGLTEVLGPLLENVIERDAKERFGEYAGYAQQYLFIYGQKNKIGAK